MSDVIRHVRMESQAAGYGAAALRRFGYDRTMKEGPDTARLAALEGPLYSQAVSAAGRGVDHNIGTRRAMLTVLETGEHCPHHLRGRKPG